MRKGFVSFQPEGSSSPCVAVSEADLDAALAAGVDAVLVDSSLGPAAFAKSHAMGGVKDLRPFGGRYAQAAGTDLLTIKNGAVLTDPPPVGLGLQVFCECATTSAFAFSSESPEWPISMANLHVNAGATMPACPVTDGMILVVWAKEGAEIESLQAGIPFFSVEDGGTLELLAIADNGINETTAAVQSGGVMLYVYDASTPPPAFSVAAGGTLIKIALDKAEAIAYSPAAVSNWNDVAPANVANALDRIASALGNIP